MQVEFKAKEIQIWKEFISLEDKIYETIKNADRTIKKFLLVLSENAKVYRGALEVVRLQRDIKSLVNFMSLQQFSDELISTWQDLQYLIELLTQEVNKLPAFGNNEFRYYAMEKGETRRGFRKIGWWIILSVMVIVFSSFWEAVKGGMVSPPRTWSDIAILVQEVEEKLKIKPDFTGSSPIG